MLNVKLIHKRVVQKGGVAKVARGSGVNELTIRKILYHNHEPRVGTLVRLACYLGLQINDVISMPNLTIPQRRQRVVVCLGTRRLDPAAFPDAPPFASIADVEGVWPVFSQSRDTRRIELQCVVRENQELLWRFENAESSSFFVIVGTSRVNRLFHHCYLNLMEHFNGQHVFTFCWPEATTTAPIRELMREGLAHNYVTVSSNPDDWGIKVLRLRTLSPMPPGNGSHLILKRDLMPPRPGIPYKDIAVVALTKRFLLVAGHGQAGTLAAGRALPTYWDTLQNLVRDRGAALLFAQITATVDADKRPITTVLDPGRVFTLTP